MSDSDDSDSRGEFDPGATTYHCEACGDECSPRDYIAVGPSTPAARHLELSDPERDHFVVCEGCFKQACAEIDANGVSPDGDHTDRSASRYPVHPDGDFDWQAMVDDLGIADLAPYSQVFITDNTGVVRRVIRTDIEGGTVRLRDEHNGQEYDVGLADLWADWRYDDLRFRTRVFLDDGEFVINDERRLAFEIVLEAAEAHAAAQDDVDDSLDEAIALLTNLRRAA